jgi:hypothetical protein
LPSLEKAFKSAKLLAETRGIGLLLEKSGTGKSCLLRRLCSSLHSGLYKPVYLCHTSVGLSEFYTHLCAGFGLQPVFRRSKTFRLIQERVLSLNRSNRIHPIFLIDEGQYLSNPLLQEIRLLTNFEIDSYNALTVLICGREELSMPFCLSILEPLANSITVTIHLEGLPKKGVLRLHRGPLASVWGQRPAVHPQCSGAPPSGLRGDHARPERHRLQRHGGCPCKRQSPGKGRTRQGGHRALRLCTARHRLDRSRRPPSRCLGLQRSIPS